MSEKLTVFLVTAAIIAPICTVCFLGSVGLAAFFGSITAWLLEVDTLVSIMIAGLIAAIAFGLFKVARRQS